jgi:hypothetical protein
MSPAVKGILVICVLVLLFCVGVAYFEDKL